MEAYFDQQKRPKVKLGITGRKQSINIIATLDTGFDGFLSLPINIAVPLGLELTGLVEVEYADGRTSKELVFSTDVNLDGSIRNVTVTLTGGSEALAGTALFKEYEIRFNFPKLKIAILK